MLFFLPFLNLFFLSICPQHFISFVFLFNFDPHSFNFFILFIIFFFQFYPSIFYFIFHSILIFILSIYFFILFLLYFIFWLRPSLFSFVSFYIRFDHHVLITICFLFYFLMVKNFVEDCFLFFSGWSRSPDQGCWFQRLTWFNCGFFFNFIFWY
jgi:hypothetical protein